MNHGKKTRNHPARSNANVEPPVSNAALPENAVETFASQVRINFYHTRKRLADPDGISGKAAIDGLVENAVLADDSAKQVQEVSHRQIKGSTEETRIVIEEVDDEA